MHVLRLCITVLLASFMCVSTAYAKAGLLLNPTRIVLEKRERNVALMIKNNGDTRGIYRVELVEMEMQEVGGTRIIPTTEEAPYSAKKLLRISPRRILLDAGQTQNIRVVVRKPKDLEDGEYRSHLKVTLIEDNVDKHGIPVKAEESTGGVMSITIKPRFSLIIPLILRHGETHYDVSLSDPAIRYPANKGKPALDLTFMRKGNQSSMGDIKVTYTDPENNASVIKYQQGLAVYRPTPKRILSLPLDLPKGVVLDKGKLDITYTEQTKGGKEGKLIAKTELTL